MVPSITHWRAAEVRMNELKRKVEPFERGDRPELTESYSFDDIVLLRHDVIEVLNFCVNAMRSNRELAVREAETYTAARGASRTLTAVLLNHSGLRSDKMRTELETWQAETYRRLPVIHYQYV